VSMIATHIYEGGNSIGNKIVKKKRTSNKITKEKKGIIKKYQKKLIENATPSEIAFKQILADMRLQYEFQRTFSRGNCFAIADFFIPALNCIVEIDGNYHKTIKQKRKDDIRTMAIMKHNRMVLCVIRFTNNQVLKHPEIVKQRLFPSIEEDEQQDEFYELFKRAIEKDLFAL
jgi:very-short-patch-repair endonuclease